MVRIVRLPALLALGFLLASGPVGASLVVLEGTIGERDVHMVLHYRNGVTRATYYDLADRTPVRIKPAFFSGSASPATDELDGEGLPRARIRLQSSWYLSTSPTTLGNWTHYQTGRTLPIRLSRVDDSQGRPATEAGPPLLQAASDDTFYFRAHQDERTKFIRQIHVFDKATGALDHVVDFGRNVCAHGLESVQVRFEAGRRMLVIEDADHCRGAIAPWSPERRRYEALP